MLNRVDRPRSVTRAALVALALLIGTLPASAQTVPLASKVVPPARPIPAFAQFQSWIQLSKTHRVGEIDDAVRTLATWPVVQIQRIDDDLLMVQMVLDNTKPVEPTARAGGRALTWKDLPALFDLPGDLFPTAIERMDPRVILKPDSPLRQVIARILVRAAMLHTDFLTSVSRDEMVAAQATTGQPGPVTLRLNDAERRNVPDFGVYWRCARTAMDLAEPTPWGKTLVHDWYVATVEYLLSQRDYASGVAHFEHARITVPGDARLALFLGAAYENLAAPPIQAAFQFGESALMVGARPILLRKAEFHLRSALLLDPNLTDAALRLGRTLLLMARPDEALPLLARAEAAELRPTSRYFAALFGGLAQVELGNAVEARRAFGRASAIFPGAQSPRLALAQLAMLASNHDEAVAAIKSPDLREPASDPWWAYDIDVAWKIETLLARVRADVNEKLQ